MRQKKSFIEQNLRRVIHLDRASVKNGRKCGAKRVWFSSIKTSFFYTYSNEITYRESPLAGANGNFY